MERASARQIRRKPHGPVEVPPEFVAKIKAMDDCQLRLALRCHEDDPWQYKTEGYHYELRKSKRNACLAEIKKRREDEVDPDVPNPEPEQPKAGVVYIIKAGERVKIGFTTNLESRLGSYRTNCPFPPEVLCKSPGTPRDEAAVHLRFHEHRLHGEWFHLTPEIQAYIDEVNAGVAA